MGEWEGEILEYYRMHNTPHPSFLTPPLAPLALPLPSASLPRLALLCLRYGHWADEAGHRHRLRR
jgi:hypothetical protein